jgi:hypothetical protein
MRFTANQKKHALKLWLEEKEDITKVAYKTKCDERTLWRWKAKYDGTLESLENGSTVPHTPSPKAHTQSEIEHIKKIFEENPDISYAEAYGVLRTEFAYSRHILGFGVSFPKTEYGSRTKWYKNISSSRIIRPKCSA